MRGRRLEKNRRRIRCNRLRAHGATNKSHHVCARRRDGEAAGTVSGRERRRCLQIIYRSRMALPGQTPKQGKIIVIIKRASITTGPDRPIVPNDDPSNPNPISRHPLSGLKWRSMAGVPFRFLRQLQWESASAVFVAIVAGFAAAALIDTVTFTALRPTQSPRPAESTRFQPTSEPVVSVQGSVEAHVPDTAHSQAPSKDRDSELPEPAFASAPIPVVSRRASIRSIRPKFPDAFRGEVRVHEEPVARSTRHPKPDEQISDLQVPADALSGTLEQRLRIGQQAADPARESIPYIVESMSESSRTPGSD
jgi:hypothetical protein